MKFGSIPVPQTGAEGVKQAETSLDKPKVERFWIDTPNFAVGHMLPSYSSMLISSHTCRKQFQYSSLAVSRCRVTFSEDSYCLSFVCEGTCASISRCTAKDAGQVGPPDEFAQLLFPQHACSKKAEP